MIEVKDLSKAYGTVQALQEVSLKVGEGEIVGVLGPNGAGKTTLIKIITGYLQPDHGKVLVDSLDVLEETREVQSRIGYLPENAPLYPELSVQAYLRMIAEMRQIPEEDQLDHISEAVYAVGLEDYLTRPIGQLSKGFRQRVGLAQAILHRPKLLILDEPTIGLDPTQIVQVRELIRRLAAYTTVLFSTHILPEVEMLCDRVLILMNGEIKEDARLEELANTTNTVLILDKKAKGVKKALAGLPGVEMVEESKTTDGFPQFQVFGEGVGLNTAVYNLASESGWALRELKYDVRTLESVFNELAVAA